ncbi:hypothetical protein [Variovorax sp. CF079]|uniref:hypothetical protein n=1 Tax=Variovorax sp. CF079 TaxID=1882774 RepID=UPI001113C406|nr:hypothetical protein [Variovorax sp. CF079]
MAQAVDRRPGSKAVALRIKDFGAALPSYFERAGQHTLNFPVGFSPIFEFSGGREGISSRRRLGRNRRLGPVAVFQYQEELTFIKVTERPGAVSRD